MPVKSAEPIALEAARRPIGRRSVGCVTSRGIRATVAEKALELDGQIRATAHVLSEQENRTPTS